MEHVHGRKGSQCKCVIEQVSSVSNWTLSYWGFLDVTQVWVVQPPKGWRIFTHYLLSNLWPKIAPGIIILQNFWPGAVTCSWKGKSLFQLENLQNFLVRPTWLLYILLLFPIYCCSVTKFCVWLFWDPVDCSPTVSSFHGISQSRLLEWVANYFSKTSSLPRDWSCVSCIGREILYHWDTREALPVYYLSRNMRHFLEMVAIHCLSQDF